MAKGGFPKFGGGMNMGNMMKQMQKMQRDLENTQLILSYFKELSKDGKTIISVTHDREYIPFADVTYELCNGKDTTIVSKIQ